MFRIAQKIICIDADPTPGAFWYSDDTPPVVGEVYTVLRNGLLCKDGRPGIDLEEIKRSEGFSYGEWRFRPVVSRPTDISLFKAMLTDERLGDLVVLQRVLERVK